ncbi:winged helix-turn-helix domain-containing protein [Propionibacteriaceae bacterium Y2011]|uniref:winged helix-turn-helix domain-containing protein n=1 Tax=Microlunatus sp. Y2014 TaxID=3418488 RepID=UPI003B4B2EC2
MAEQSTTRPVRLGRPQARRIALAAQGFGVPRPDRAIGMRDVQRVIDQVAQFQIDTINVVTRAHHMPLYSRLGPYDLGLLERASHNAPRRLFEYWGHAASMIDSRLQPQLRWRMAQAEREAWGGIVRLRQEQPELINDVLAEVTERGPITARQIDHDEERRRDHWGWNWSSVKTACEWLLWAGQLSSAGRNKQFERRYAPWSKVLPATILAEPTPTEEEAVVALVRRAARALGVASELCLRDYFRTRGTATRPAIDALVESGELLPATVEGWDRPAYLWHKARKPRSISTRALVSPFDSMVFERERLLALFGVDYKIEIYVPEAKRQYGYYSYLLLWDSQFVARVDLKADRKAGVLRVRSAWREPAADPGTADPDIAEQLVAELWQLAGWLGLDDLAVEDRGTLAAATRDQLEAAV